MIEVERFILSIGIEFEFCIDRYDIIVTTYLDAVARIEHRRDIRVDRPAREITEFRPHLPEAEVCPDCYLVKPRRLQQIGYSNSVAWRIGQIGDGFVSAIANYQRHTFLRPCRIGDFEVRAKGHRDQ